MDEVPGAGVGSESGRLVTRTGVQQLDLVAEARRQWVSHGWAGPDRGMAAVVSLMRAQQIVLGRLEDVVRGYGFSYARYELLTLLSFSRKGELPLSKIGDRLQVHPASVTGAVDKLEQQGLVVRVPHPEVRRTTLARITEHGREWQRRPPRNSTRVPSPTSV